MNDNFNLIAQSKYYFKKFINTYNDFSKFSESEQDYVLRNLALLIQECIELVLKGLVELLVGVDYKHTNLLSDNILVIRNNKSNIINYDSLETILDEIDAKAARISDFHTKAVYVSAFSTSIKELTECKILAEKLHLWIDKNLTKSRG